MLKSILKEIQIQKHYLPENQLESIYFGGGSPSLLHPRMLEELLDTLSRMFQWNPSIEITLEANPDDLDPMKLKDLKSIGINRLSIGVQSFDNSLLKFLNRVHDSQQAIKSLEYAKNVGFENISMDLIFSIPSSNIQILQNDLKTAIDLDLSHISIYSLTIEEKTAFGNWLRKGKISEVPENQSAEEFEVIMSTLEANGYDQYEVSNFCRAEMYSIHNSSYWKNIPYLGIGPGAHSYNGQERQFNIRHNHQYMKSIENGSIPNETDPYDPKTRANEYLLTSLRTKWGCDAIMLKNLYDVDILDLKQSQIAKLSQTDLIETREKTLFLTKSGRMLADSITEALMID